MFGIGLNKTGTKTLAACLRQLGFAHLSYRRDLLQKVRDGKLKGVYRAIDAFESFDDWPYPLIYRELAGHYPDARFVLTLRTDADVWLGSLKRHALRTPPFNHSRKLVYGRAYPQGNEAHFREFYRRHEREVRAHFAQHGPERLLVLCWERGDGWQELCGFLGLEVPDTPFPHENRQTRKPGLSGLVRQGVNLANAKVRSLIS